MKRRFWWFAAAWCIGVAFAIGAAYTYVAIGFDVRVECRFIAQVVFALGFFFAGMSLEAER